MAARKKARQQDLLCYEQKRSKNTFDSWGPGAVKLFLPQFASGRLPDRHIRAFLAGI